MNGRQRLIIKYVVYIKDNYQYDTLPFFKHSSCLEVAASILGLELGLEYSSMANNSGALLIVYTSPRIGDWENLRQLIAGNFPEFNENDVSYLIRNGMDKMIIARCDQQLLGFCYFEEFSPSKLHLLWLATDKNFYHRGVASKIIKHLEYYAIDKGYRSIVLTVKKNNQAARRFYEKMEFFLTKEHKGKNKESWEKILDDECVEPVIKFGFWGNNNYPLRVLKKILYRYLTN